MWLTRLMHYLWGYRRLTCPGNRARYLINLLLKNDIDYWDMRMNESGQLTCFVDNRRYRRMSAGDSRFSWAEITVSPVLGLPAFFDRYRYRYGIPCGIVIFLFIMIFSSGHVWQIEIRGNAHVEDKAILNTLDELGLRVGTPVRQIDFYELCHRFILKNEDISWVSVSMIGTTARIEVIEEISPDSSGEKDNGSPANLVAARDGEIVRIESIDGVSTVIGGQQVKQGQLLISGVVNTDRDDESKFLLVRAKGQVYAKTSREFLVSVPIKQIKREIVCSESVAKKLIFFDKTVKLKKTSSILPADCDIMQKEHRVRLGEKWGLLGGITLPISVIENTALFTEEKEVTISEAQALVEANLQMASLVASELPHADILLRKTDSRVVFEDDAQVLELSLFVECIEDIAEERPIGVG